MAAQTIKGKNISSICKLLIDTDKLPEDVKHRINALRYYQDEHEKLEAKFQKEVLALERKYLEKYTPLYEIRAEIVQGKTEPTQKTVDAGIKIDEEEKKRLGEQSDEEEDEEEEKTKTGKIEEENKIVEENKGPFKGIPGFWLSAMKQLVAVSDIITQLDEEALNHLIDIKMAYLEKPGFELIFEFEENPFFTNKVLKKTYLYQEEPGYGGDFVYDHAEGTQIMWNEGKDLTKIVKSKNQKNNGRYFFLLFFQYLRII
jgi:nucleosome assembly protein 1-like 1